MAVYRRRLERCRLAASVIAAALFVLAGEALAATPPTGMPQVRLKAAVETHQPLRLKPGKPQFVRFDAEIGDVIVDDMPNHLAAFAHGPKTVALFPKKPGGAHVVIRGKDGKELMSRYVFIAEPDKKYMRVLLDDAAAAPGSASKDRVYFCPNLCYQTHIVAPPPTE